MTVASCGILFIRRAWIVPNALAFDLVGRFTQRLGTKRWDRTTSH
jgi:hypothetical protein